MLRYTNCTVPFQGREVLHNFLKPTEIFSFTIKKELEEKGGKHFVKNFGLMNFN